MSSSFKKLEDNFNRLSIRERLLVFVTIGISVFIFTESTFITPAIKEKNKIKTELANMMLRLDASMIETKMMYKKFEKDPLESKKQRKARIEQEIQEYEKQLEALTSNLMTPKEMTTVLSRMLEGIEDIKIIKLQSLEPTALSLSDTPNKKDSEKIQLYKHGLQMSFEASYFATLDYIERVENMNLKIMWSDLNYRVGKYPNATVDVIVYTLSDEKEWLGV